MASDGRNDLATPRTPSARLRRANSVAPRPTPRRGWEESKLCLSRRRLLVSIGVAIASTGLLAVAGCQPTRPTPAEPPVLQVELPEGELPAVRSLLESTVREHARNRGYRLALSFGDPDSLPARYLPGTGTLPDVAVAGTLGPARLFWDLSLLDVTEAAEKAARVNGELPPALRRALTSDEKLWAVPFYGRAWAWLLRQDLLEAKSLPPPGTFAEALDVATKLVDPARNLAGWALPLAPSRETEALVHQVIVDYGGALADESGRRVVLASPETVEAVAFLAGLVRGQAARATLPIERRAWDAPTREAEFQAGRVAMAPVSAELYSRLVVERAFPGKALRAMLPPAGPKRRTTGADGRHFIIARSTKHPDLSLSLVAEVLAPARLREMMVKSDGALVPAYANLSSDSFWDLDPIKQVFAASVRGDLSRQLEVVEAGFPGPSTPGAGEVASRLVLSQMVARCVDDGLPPDLAVQEGHARAQVIYDEVSRRMAAIRRRA